MTIRKQNPVVAELLNIYNEALTSVMSDKQDVSRIMSVRCSSLPFCSLEFFVNNAVNGTFRYLDMKGSFYTAMGTSVHSTVQKYLSTSGKFLANWHCRICNTKYKLSMQHECCDFTCDYDEIYVEFNSRFGKISGHIDGIFKAKDGLYYIVDYKTTGVKAAPKKAISPGVVYIDQVENYAMLMWMHHKIKIAGVMLFFIPRDNPEKPVVYFKDFTDLSMQKVKLRTKVYLQAHKQTLEVITLNQALDLYKIYGKCKNIYCKICTKSNIVELITEAYKIGNNRNNLPLKNLGQSK